MDRIPQRTHRRDWLVHIEQSRGYSGRFRSGPGRSSLIDARVEKEIHNAPNRVRYAMNMFVIAVGTYVQPLSELAMQAGQRIGKVSVDVGETACKVPFAPDYIDKVRQAAARSERNARRAAAERFLAAGLDRHLFAVHGFAEENDGGCPVDSRTDIQRSPLGST